MYCLNADHAASISNVTSRTQLEVVRKDSNVVVRTKDVKSPPHPTPPQEQLLILRARFRSTGLLKYHHIWKTYINIYITITIIWSYLFPKQHMEISKVMGVPLFLIHFSGIFHEINLPTIKGYHHDYGNTPMYISVMWVKQCHKRTITRVITMNLWVVYFHHMSSGTMVTIRFISSSTPYRWYQ